MVMSRVKLDTNRVETMKSLSSPQILHAIIEGCFTEKNRTLWRIDSLYDNLYLLIVSEHSPDLSNLVSQLCVSGEVGQSKNYTIFLESIKNGQGLHFRFRGNPVRSIATDKDKRGKVVPYFNDRQKKEWLINKSSKNGFVVDYDSCSIIETRQLRFYKKGNEKPIRLSCTTFEGMLTVTDMEQFVTALSMGIGRGKSYGCGLMTVMVI